MKSRIISFDGGGIKGLLSITLLERLHILRPNILDNATMYAGTSTGGIIAVCLAAGLPPAAIKALYLEKGEKIFKPNGWHAWGLLGPRFRNTGLRAELDIALGGRFLSDLKKRILIPSFDLDNAQEPPRRNWKPKFFSNFDPTDNDNNIYATEVCMRTSAAPTYFPSFQGYIDGGVCANNPSDCAVIEVLNTGERRFGVKGAPAEKVTLEDIALLSIGTGQSPKWVEGSELNWGAAHWGFKLLDILMEGVGGVSHYRCKHLLGPRYCRLDPVLPEPIDLADWKKADKLVEVAEEADLRGCLHWLDEHFV
jgi:patatin-like phospholipase/acyl hydrolase